jgi:hypothetical protein
MVGTLTVGQQATVDLNHDGTNDLTITLTHITYPHATLVVERQSSTQPVTQQPAPEQHTTPEQTTATPLPNTTDLPANTTTPRKEQPTPIPPNRPLIAAATYVGHKRTAARRGTVQPQPTPQPPQADQASSELAQHIASMREQGTDETAIQQRLHTAGWKDTTNPTNNDNTKQ